MPYISSNAAKQLSDGSSRGTVMGQRSDDPISFYGVTPVVQGAFPTTASTVSLVNAGVGSTAGVGFSTVALFGAYMSTVRNIQADLDSLRTALVNLGLLS